jgi:ribonuclease Y
MDPTQPALWVTVAGLSLLAAVASVTWLLLSSHRAKGRVRRAHELAESLVAEARRESENLRKVAILEGREELHAARSTLEREAVR